MPTIALWLATDGAEAAARLVVRRLTCERLAERRRRRGRVSFHQIDVAPEDVHPGGPGKHLFVEPQQGECLLVLGSAPETESGDVERALSEVIRIAPVIPLTQRPIGADRGVAAGSRRCIDQ